MRITIHRAKDGTEFITAAECRSHDIKEAFGILAGLSHGDLHAGIGRENLKIANALELAGKLVATKRRESGERRRAPKNPRNQKEPKS